MSAGGSKKVIIISLLANLGIALSKLVAAIFTGSAALMAESVHSFSDCGNQALLLYGGYVARKSPTKEYPLGRGKELFFWSFVVALLLFSMGGIFSLYEGFHKIHNPGELSYPLVGIIVLLVAVGLESVSFFACYKEVKSINQQKNLWQWIKHTTAADLLVIFLEDLAALLGLVFALIALSASWITGDTFYDGLGSCVIGVILICVAVVLAKEVKHMLVGQNPSVDYKSGVQDILSAIMPDAQIIRFVALQQGVNEILLAYKVKPADMTETVKTVIEKVNKLEAAVKQKFPEIKWQFAELDDRD